MSEIKPSEVTSILRQQLQNFNLKTEMEETGTVLLVGDGIARVYGLQNARSGELVTFESKSGGETVTETLSWDFSTSDWQTELGKLGASGADIATADMTYDGLTLFWKSKCKYGATYLQFGGAGVNKETGALDRYMKFTAPEAGTLTVTASNTGSSEDLTRMVYVKVGDDVQQLGGGVPSTSPATLEFSVAAGDVYISTAGNGLRIYKIHYTNQ